MKKSQFGEHPLLGKMTATKPSPHPHPPPSNLTQVWNSEPKKMEQLKGLYFLELYTAITNLITVFLYWAPEYIF